MGSIQVLSLTTTAWRSFYEQQEAALAEAGVAYTTREVPGDHRAFHDGVRERSTVDYLRFFPSVLREVPGHDVVHANYGLTAPFAVAQPRPAVLTLWGGEFVANPYAPLIRACTRLVDEVVVPSQALACEVPVVSRPVGFAPSVLDNVDRCYVGRTERELRSHLASVLEDGERPDSRDSVLGYGTAEMGEHLRTLYERCLD